VVRSHRRHARTPGQTQPALHETVYRHEDQDSGQIEKRGDQYQVIVEISSKYRGSFNTLAFGEINPFSGSLKEGRLDLVYYRNPNLSAGDSFPLWTLH
jgi:hypothetical protein